jgi:non-heme chloroperoxidase
MQRRSILRSAASAAVGAGLVGPVGAAVGSGGATSAARAPRALSTPFIERDDVSLFYQDWGTGPPVVFVHGWALGGDMWEYQTTHLTRRGLRCIAYDKRGCGRSSQPGQGYDFDTFADDLAALVEQLGLREVTLVAHSMGGGDVARYLSRHGPGRVARAVLIGSITPFLLKTEDNPEGVDKTVFEGMVAELSKDRPHYLAATTPTFFGVGLPDVSVSPEIMQWGVDLALRASPLATIEMVRAFSTADFRRDMRAFTIPTLIVHGGADQSVPFVLSGAKTARLISGSQLKLYEGAAHGLFITHKDRLNGDLLAFVKG